MVLAIGLSVRYLVARARERVVNRLPEALREIRGEFDSDAEGGPRTTGATWTYRAKVAPKHGLWIRNTRGSVIVEGGRGDSVQISAVKSYRSSDTASVRLVAVPSDAGLTVCAVWPGSPEGCTPDEDFKAGRTRGSDITVDFNALTTPQDKIAVIATTPLTDNETWTNMKPRGLFAFQHGAPVLEA